MAQIHVPCPPANFHVLNQPATGQYFDVVANNWVAAPASGAWSSNFALAKAQAGGTALWGVIIPDGAGTVWQVVTYYVAAPNVSQMPALVSPYVVAPDAPAPAPTSVADQTPVPAERTSRLIYDEALGLVSEKPRSVALGVTGLYSIDFGIDLPFNNIIETIDSAVPIGGGGSIAGEITGRDRQLAKVRLTGQQLGQVFLKAKITALGSGHESEALVEYNVVDPSSN